MMRGRLEEDTPEICGGLCFAVTRECGAVVVSLSGRLDEGNAPEAEGAFLSLGMEGGMKLVVDCSGLEYISSAGLRVLLLAARQWGRSRVALCGARETVAQVMQIAGMPHYYALCATRGEAFSLLGLAKN